MLVQAAFSLVLFFQSFYNRNVSHKSVDDERNQHTQSNSGQRASCK